MVPGHFCQHVRYQDAWTHTCFIVCVTSMSTLGVSKVIKSWHLYNHEKKWKMREWIKKFKAGNKKLALPHYLKTKNCNHTCMHHHACTSFGVWDAHSRLVPQLKASSQKLARNQYKAEHLHMTHRHTSASLTLTPCLEVKFFSYPEEVSSNIAKLAQDEMVSSPVTESKVQCRMEALGYVLNGSSVITD